MTGAHSDAKTTLAPTPVFKAGDISVSWVPLTTVFTYEPSCRDRWVQMAPRISESSGALWSAEWGGDWYTACQASHRKPVYSPGVCPNDHTIATLSEVEKTRTGTGEHGDDQRKWWAICCLSGFTPSEGWCKSIFSTAQTAYDPLRSYTTTKSDETYTIFTKDFEATDSIVTVTRGTMVAQYISIAWRGQDLSLFDSSYASELASTLGISLNIATATSSRAPASATSPVSTAIIPSDTGTASSGGVLNTGTKAGISIGAVVGVFGIAFVTFLIWRKKREGKFKRSNSISDGVDMSELIEIHNPMQQSQGNSDPVNDLCAKHQSDATRLIEPHAELDSLSPLQELPSPDSPK